MLIEERNERLQVDAAWVLQQLKELAGVDIGDLYAEDGALLPIKEMPKAVHRFITAIDYTKDGVRIRFVDRVRLLELIGKHVTVSAFTQNIALVKEDEIEKNILAGRARAKAARELGIDLDELDEEEETRH